MRRALTFFIIVASGISVSIRALPSETLSYASVPVDFVNWRPTTPELSYSDLALSVERVRELEAAEQPFVDRLLRIELRLLADGSIEERILFSRVYLTQSGVQEAGNLDFWVDAGSQVASIQQAYVLYPNGRMVSADADATQILPEAKDDIFTDRFRIIVPFSGLEPRAIAVLVVTIRDDGDRQLLPWSAIYWPQWFAPIEEFDFRIAWEEGRRKPRWQSDSELVECDSPGTRELRCRATRIPAYPQDPDVRYADAMPALVVAEDISWQALSDRVREIVYGSLTDDPVVDEVTAELLAGATSDEERLDRIHQFVSQKIRYVGLEQGAGGVVPRRPAVTLERRFGDCKDKTTLFIELARRAGLDAYPVLTSSERNNLARLSIPASAFFDHMVACVPLSAYEEHCVDLTDPYSPYEMPSAFLQGAIRLNLRSETAIPSEFPVSRFRRSKEQKTANRFDADGSLEERREIRYVGPTAALMRAALQPMSQSERQEWALQRYHEQVSNQVNPQFRFGGIQNVRRPVSLSSAVTYRGVLDIRDPGIFAEIETSLSSEAAFAATGNTSHDYNFGGLRYRGTTIYQLIDGIGVAHTGPALNFESEFGSLHRIYRNLGKSLHVETELSVPSGRISLDAVPRFNRFLDHVRDNAIIWFAMKREAPDG